MCPTSYTTVENKQKRIIPCIALVRTSCVTSLLCFRPSRAFDHAYLACSVNTCVADRLCSLNPQHALRLLTRWRRVVQHEEYGGPTTGKVVQCEQRMSNLLQIKSWMLQFLCLMSFLAQVLYSYSIGFVYILTGLLCVGGLGPAVAFCSEVRRSWPKHWSFLCLCLWHIQMFYIFWVNTTIILFQYLMPLLFWFSCLLSTPWRHTVTRSSFHSRVILAFHSSWLWSSCSAPWLQWRVSSAACSIMTTYFWNENTACNVHAP